MTFDFDEFFRCMAYLWLNCSLWQNSSSFFQEFFMTIVYSLIAK